MTAATPQVSAHQEQSRAQEQLTRLRNDAAVSVIGILEQNLDFSRTLDADQTLLAISATKMSSLLEIDEAEPILEAALAATEPREYEPVRLEILAGLARFGQRAPLLELRQRMTAERGVVRLDFARNLVELGDESALSILREAVYQRETDPRWYAVQTLAKFHDELAKQYLVAGLSQDNAVVRFDCAWVMARAGWNEGFSVLNDYRAAPDFERRFHAAEALAYLGDTQAQSFIVNLIENGSRQERSEAIIRAGAIPILRARAAIEKSLESLENLELVTALFALGNIGDSGSLEKLLLFAKSGNPLVQLAGNSALIQIIEGRKVPMGDTF